MNNPHHNARLTPHSLAVANADRLFQRATYGWAKTDARGDANIRAIHRLFAPMRTPDGKTVLVKLTVKETVHSKEANPLYTLEAVDVGEGDAPASKWVAACAAEDGLTSTLYAEAPQNMARALDDFNASSRAKADLEAIYSREQIVARICAGQTAAEVAAALAVSVRTVREWLARLRAGGQAALSSHASAPARVAGRLREATVALILHLRRSLRMTGAAIAAKLGLARSTVSRWLRREGLGRLAQIDPPEPVRRYQRERRVS